MNGPGSASPAAPGAGAGDRDALVALSAAYAAAADRRDAAAFVAVFTDDARLTVHMDGRGPGRVHRGHAELAEIPGRLERYHRTLHLVGAGHYEFDPTGSRATGEVPCVAHHLGVDGEHREDRSLYIHYRDRYERTGSGWRIAERVVDVGWIETRVL